MFPVRLSWCVVLENLLNFSEHCLSLRKKKERKSSSKVQRRGLCVKAKQPNFLVEKM